MKKFTNTASNALYSFRVFLSGTIRLRRTSISLIWDENGDSERELVVGWSKKGRRFYFLNIDVWRDRHAGSYGYAGEPDSHNFL